MGSIYFRILILTIFLIPLLSRSALSSSFISKENEFNYLFGNGNFRETFRSCEKQEDKCQDIIALLKSKKFSFDEPVATANSETAILWFLKSTTKCRAPKYPEVKYLPFVKGYSFPLNPIDGFAVYKIQFVSNPIVYYLIRAEDYVLYRNVKNPEIIQDGYIFQFSCKKVVDRKINLMKSVKVMRIKPNTCNSKHWITEPISSGDRHFVVSLHQIVSGDDSGQCDARTYLYVWELLPEGIGTFYSFGPAN